jgi:hypothetical protein
MPHRRQAHRGSFGGHFDELVKQFPGQGLEQPHEPRHKRTARLQEKIDIHARLFERAWEVDFGSPDSEWP